MLESARGIRPDDQSETAKAARTIAGWQDLDQLRFMIRVGVKPAEGNYQAKNTVREVITPDRTSVWTQPQQVSRPAGATNGSVAAAPAAMPPPVGAIQRPDWAR
jgi:hypothetical protein